MKELFLQEFARTKPTFGPAETARWGEMRKKAIDEFAALGLPTPRWEEWRNTDLSALTKTRISFENGSPKNLDDRSFLPAGWENSPSIVFINGNFTPAGKATLPKGLDISTFRSASEELRDKLERHLGQVALGKRPFASLNTAFAKDGALISIAPKAVLEAPIYVVYFSSPGKEAHFSAPRTLIVAGRESQATIIEVYAGTDEPYFTNALTEVVTEPHAQLEHIRLELEGSNAFHISTTDIEQDRSSHYRSHSFSIGGKLVRNEINTLLNAEGSECTLNGLYVPVDHQHIDHRTFIDHSRPHCSSRELYKGVLAGEARGVFLGKITVRPDAQKSDARQTNNNLILSEKALADSTPQLEINADDVKCSHGATIGKLDENALFYLRSRGIGEKEAQNLLIHSFVSEMIEATSVAPIRFHLEHLLSGRFVS